MNKKNKRRKFRGTVQKLIRPAFKEKEKVQIGIEESEPLYQEIRVENTLTDQDGAKFALRAGAEVDVIIEADSDATTKKPD